MYEFIGHRIEFIGHRVYEFILLKYEFISGRERAAQAASAQREPRARSASCERAARAASAQREPRGRSPSSPPAPTRPRPAAPTVRVAFGCPDQLGCVRLPRPVRVRSAAPASCERAARAASAKREPRGRSPSSPPAPIRPRPAAPTVRVAFGCPDQLGCVRLPRPVRVRSAAPIS
jgi:hypothetical protein